MSQSALFIPQFEDIRVLSLTQPWATAMAVGLKSWETRSWNTSFRGYLAIHASKGFPREAREFAKGKRRRHGAEALPIIEHYPLGEIVAVGLLTETRRTEDALGDISQDEERWGDYSRGRFAFRFQLLSRIIPPVPAKGSLGLWKPSRDLLVSIAVNSEVPLR